jgi:hypothetical protein
MDKIARRSLVILCAFSLAVACGDDDDGGSDGGGDGGSTTSDDGGTGTTGDDGGSGTGGDDGGTATDGGSDDGGTATGSGDGGTGTGTGTGTNACPPDPSDAECSACMKENCCDGYLACLEDADCACVIECMDGGGGGTGTGTGTGTGEVNCPALCNGGGDAWSGFSYCVGGFCGDQSGGNDVCPSA